MPSKESRVMYDLQVSMAHRMAASLARATGANALVPNLRLTPEHPFPAQLDDAVVAYRWLLPEGFEPAHIASAEDSGGGNLATTLVLRLRDEQNALPAAIVAFSPWFDTQAGGESLDLNADDNPFLSRASMRHLSAQYLGGASATDPLANPLYADLSGLPPVYMAAAGH